MAQFMLLLHADNSGFMKLSPEEMQKAIEKYSAWRSKPFVRGSNRLADDPGKIMRGAGANARTTDGPYSEGKEVLGGYYLIEAANYEQAVALAADHPHLEHGTIELRQVWGS
jgi:hypothetical protein